MVLICGISDVGQPAVAQFRWTRNGHVIPEISDAVWNVSQVTLNYQANYTCTPVNEAGEGETASVEIEVYGRPTQIFKSDQLFMMLSFFIGFVTFDSSASVHRTFARNVRRSLHGRRSDPNVVPRRMLSAVRRPVVSRRHTARRLESVLHCQQRHTSQRAGTSLSQCSV